MSVKIQKIVMTEDADHCAPSGKDVNRLEVKTADAGAGAYYVLSTKRWAFESIDELIVTLMRVKVLLDIEKTEEKLPHPSMEGLPIKDNSGTTMHHNFRFTTMGTSELSVMDYFKGVFSRTSEDFGKIYTAGIDPISNEGDLPGGTGRVKAQISMTAEYDGNDFPDIKKTRHKITIANFFEAGFDIICDDKMFHCHSWEEFFNNFNWIRRA